MLRDNNKEARHLLSVAELRRLALPGWSRLQRFRWGDVGLPAKLLLLTAAFVMLAEILIFLPSVANFRLSWLDERLGVGDRRRAGHDRDG